jgi:hypothetical protein
MPRPLGRRPDGACEPSCLVSGAMYAVLAPEPVLVPIITGMCEPLHILLIVQKMMGCSKAICDGDHSYRRRSAVHLSQPVDTGALAFPVAAEGEPYGSVRGQTMRLSR